MYIMGLTVEISFDIQKNVNVITTQNYLKYIAEKNNCIDNYFIFEIEGENTYISRNDCIQIIEFNLDINVIKYIKEIEKYKFVKIDCIYLENKVIYLSKRYIFFQKLHNKNVESINTNKNNIINVLINLISPL